MSSMKIVEGGSIVLNQASEPRLIAAEKPARPLNIAAFTTI
jgi:hypothetical protein